MYEAVRGIPHGRLPGVINNTLGQGEHDRPQGTKVLGGHEQAKVTHHLAAAPLDYTVRLRSFRESQNLLNLKQEEKLQYDLVDEVRALVRAHRPKATVPGYDAQQAVRCNNSARRFNREELTVMGRHTHTIEYVRVPHVISRKRPDKIDAQFLEDLV